MLHGPSPFHLQLKTPPRSCYRCSLSSYCQGNAQFLSSWYRLLVLYPSKWLKKIPLIQTVSVETVLCRYTIPAL